MQRGKLAAATLSLALAAQPLCAALQLDSPGPILPLPGTALPASPAAEAALAAPAGAPAVGVPAALAGKLAPLTGLAADFARLSAGVKIPRARDGAVRAWLDRSFDMARGASGEEPTEALGELFVGDDGSVSAFYGAGGKLYQQELASSELKPVEGVDPRGARGWQLLQRLGKPGTFLPITAVGNLLDPRPNRLFEPEGDLVSTLRDMGVRGATINKLVPYFAGMDRWIGYDGRDVVYASPEYRRFLTGVLALSAGSEQAGEKILRDYAQARVFRGQLRAYLRANPELTAAVAAHASFGRWARDFRAAYLPAHGYSDSFLAENLLLESLARGAQADPALAELPGYLAFAALSIASSLPAAPAPSSQALEEALAQARRDVAARSGWLETSLVKLGEALGVLPKAQGPGAWSDRLDAVERFYRQMGVENAGGFSQESRYTYTVDRLYSGSSYFPNRPPFPPRDAAWPRRDLRQSLRFLLTGNRSFFDFEEKFAQERWNLRDALAVLDHPALPGFGALLTRTIEPAAVLRSTLLTEHPFVINRFFKGYSSWEEMSWNRVAFDFARGVELQLLRRVGYPRFLLRLVSNWKPEDFSSVSDADIDWAVDRALRVADIRLKRMTFAPRRLSEYRVKDVKDFFKKLALSRVPKTKFLRHPFDWKSYFGVGWTCMCWARESLFRVGFKK